ncbi:MAG: cation transporter [Hydrocarboniphaga sp.]|uniref:efflux RND transporter periplasmic adaptor subunit n=1 Tax=Hydrocarboniphaga sp. TaxID=2033016 RepID=UPI00261B3FD3|nr:efflux RND transporter periplasmic adaptor subunit [Hydrocarboniphaga sp.]MDB5968894.1 cation transporter [Hydrocarboniphaga sp.]
MNPTIRILAALFFCALAVACTKPASEPAGEHDAAEAEVAKGPHGGRLLVDGPFAVELLIFEQGMEPQYRAWATSAQKLVPANLSVELTRLDGEKNRFLFAPEGDYLKGDGIVHEPHSFSVVVAAEHQGQAYRWSYDSFEGRTRIDAEIAKASGIVVDMAGPATIVDAIELSGRIVPDAESVRSVAARFPGTIRSLAKSLGDEVRAGEVLARVESNDSLQVYAVTSPIAGVITERHANAGEQAGSDPLFVVSRFDKVWAELAVFPRDLSRIRPGQRVRVRAADGELAGEGEVTRVAPVGDSANQAHTVRVSLDNAQRAWTPGLFVNAQLQVGAADVPLAVKEAGLQRFRDFTVVFEQVGDQYEVRMLQLGRRDGEVVEVLSGLKTGARYVSGNSYLIKADIEKSGASHDH